MSKTVFFPRETSGPIVSVRSDSPKNGEAYSTFTLNEGTSAMALLFIGAARAKLDKKNDYIPIISGDSSSFIAAFETEVAKNSKWIADLFNLDSARVNSVASIFQRAKFGEIISVLMNLEFFNHTEISIILENKHLRLQSEIRELEERLARELFRADGSELDPKKRGKIVSLYPSASTDEVKYSSLGVVAPNVLDLFTKKLEEQLIRNGVGAVRERIDALSNRELAYHLSQHTEVELTAEHDWKISFEFEVINAGFLPISTRLHQYWFEIPQDEVEYSIFDSEGTPIKYNILKSSEKYRQISLELPRVLNALDRIKYKISYKVKGIVEQNSFYYLSPRTLTKKLSLTVKGHKGYKFENQRVAVETEGGFHRDEAPELTLTSENGIETLHWSQLSPKPGELYRTLWSNANFNLPAQVVKQEKEIKNNLVQLLDRLPIANQ